MKIGIDSEIQGTSVPIRWCLGRDELSKLAGTGKKAYVLLLVVTGDYNSEGYLKETRYLAPIEQMMEYLNFYTPGKHTIFSTVVWKQEQEDENLQRYFLRKYKEHDGYKHSLYDYHDGVLYKDSFDIRKFGVHKFEVSVPREVFAKEPPAWEKKWVNLFWGGKSADQCHYRKKRVFAYSFQLIFFPPILASIELASLVIISTLLLFGIKGIGFRKILYPFSEPFSSIWDETNGSIFGKFRLLPSIFLGSCVTSWVFCRMFGFQFVGLQSIWEAIIIGGIATGAAVAASGLVVLSYCGVARAIDKIRNALISEERRERKILLAKSLEEERIKKIQERLQAEYALLACDGSLSADIKNLPQSKKTIHLRYQDLKSRICKSFAR